MGSQSSIPGLLGAGLLPLRAIRCYILAVSTSPRSPNSGLSPQDLKPGERYELSDGHTVYCAPASGHHGMVRLLGGLVLAADPGVDSAAFDAGFAIDEKTLRAPDISVGNVSDEPGWVHGAPLLAVEYADLGQDGRDLAAKIAELLKAGTRMVWVVRLAGPRRVEVHQAGQPTCVRTHGELLEAPGILKNPFPVEALYNRDAAFEATLRNLLERKGYPSVEAVREEGREQGRVQAGIAALLAVLAARGLPVSDSARHAIEACTELDKLALWLRRAATAQSEDEVLHV